MDESIDLYNRMGSFITQVCDPIKVLRHIEPVNLSGEKEAFFNGKGNPEFQYAGITYDSKKVAEDLSNLEISGDEICTIYDGKRKTELLNNYILQNLGDPEVIRSSSIQLYGVPSEDLVKYAEQLLKDLPQTEAIKNVPSSRVKSALEDSLKEYGLDDWNIELSKKQLTGTSAADKTITLCEDRLFSELDVTRLGVHEVGVHALRGVNGAVQPFKIFETGLPGYLSTEEGLAGYAEQQTGNTSPEIMGDYAARVIAVDSVCQNLDFRQTFNRLKDMELSDEQSWNLSVRAHRGGGFVKDHVYLQGIREVESYVSDGGKIDALFVGKVGISDLPLVNNLLKRKILKKAKYKPKFK